MVALFSDAGILPFVQIKQVMSEVDTENNPSSSLDKPTSETSDTEIEPEDAEVIDGIPADLFDKLPPETRKMLSVFMSHRYVGPIPNPVLNKITGSHIDKILDSSEKDEQRAFDSSKGERLYRLAYVLIAVGFLVFLTVYLTQVDKQLYENALKIIVGFLGGLGTGFGISRATSKKKK